MFLVASPHRDQVSFGPFRLDVRTGALFENGQAVHLAHQPARLLSLLALHAGEVVTRDSIRQHLWADDTNVEYDAGMNFCLAQIRAVLHDEASSPRFIETIPRSGYRFIADIERHANHVVAVLPFDNLTGDSSSDWIADGITDALITALGTVEVLRVLSRQSVLHLKRSTATLPLIARELGVDAVLEGTILVDRVSVRISAHLVLVDPERQVWSQSYEGAKDGILDLQSSVVRDIAGSVERTLAAEQLIDPRSA